MLKNHQVLSKVNTSNQTIASMYIDFNNFLNLLYPKPTHSPAFAGLVLITYLPWAYIQQSHLHTQSTISCQ